jgi:(2Fe-2S) ferredoxin
MRCHVSCILPLRRRILQLGCHMARRKETTIERIYREVTGNKMPAAVKRVLLRKRKVKRH